MFECTDIHVQANIVAKHPETILQSDLSFDESAEVSRTTKSCKYSGVDANADCVYLTMNDRKRTSKVITMDGG